VPRAAHDTSQAQNFVRWSCSSASDGTVQYTWDDPKGDRAYVDLSDAGVIMKFNERGMDNCPCPVGVKVMYPGCIESPNTAFREPRCVFKMVTPKVREKAREYFDCDWLPGAELENQPTSGCVIVGSHWEERIFMGELMTSGQFGDYIFLSQITLAVFEDSGWYVPDYSMADPLVKGLHWGFEMGCAFATEKCVSEGKTDFPQFWCAEEGARRCSLDRKSEVMCTTVEAPVKLPPAVQYFQKPVVGDTPEADYCPYYHTGISNHVCTDTSSETFPISNVNFMREVFGSDSRCLDSTLHSDMRVAGGTYEADPSLFVQVRPGCFKVVCRPDNAAYDVRISNTHGGTVALGTCGSEGQTLMVNWLRGAITCAAPRELCGLPPSVHVSQLYMADELVEEEAASHVARASQFYGERVVPGPYLFWGLLATAGAVGAVAAFALRRGGGRPGPAAGERGFQMLRSTLSE